MSGASSVQKQSLAAVLKNFVNFTEKYVLESLFNKVAGLKVFSCETSKILRTLFLQNTYDGCV